MFSVFLFFLQSSSHFHNTPPACPPRAKNVLVLIPPLVPLLSLNHTDILLQTSFVCASTSASTSRVARASVCFFLGVCFCVRAPPTAALRSLPSVNACLSFCIRVCVCHPLLRLRVRLVMVNYVDTRYQLMQTRSAGHAVDTVRSNVALESVRDGEEMEQAVSVESPHAPVFADPPCSWSSAPSDLDSHRGFRAL